MNVVVVMSDTFRADHLKALNLKIPWKINQQDSLTPHLDAFASQSTVFERFYVSSYPTILCRRDLFIGKYTFPTSGWIPLQPDDLSLAEILGEHGINSEFIFDTPPLADNDFNFQRGFTGWEWVRGQHQDRWVNEPLDITLPSDPHKTKDPILLRRYLLNATRRLYEKDWMCARTFSTAMDWLERNASRDNFFLWIDTWDPHEPFEAPSWDLQLYVDKNYKGKPVIYPVYGRSNYLSDAEINDIRARYAAKVRLVDRWFGKLVERLDVLGLYSNMHIHALHF